MRQQWIHFSLRLPAILLLALVGVHLGLLCGAASGQTEGEPPFVDDPAVIGTWYSVDFVPSVEQFVPGQRFWKEDLYLADITFEPGGAASGWWRWSKGFAWDSREKNLCNYAFNHIGGTEYMFFEWVNSDVTQRGQKPFYYVLVRGEAKKTSSSDLSALSGILALVNIGTGLLFILLSIPLALRRIPMNTWYGYRFKKAFMSNDLWYNINAYGGKQMIRWSSPLTIMSVAIFFLMDVPGSLVAQIAVSVCLLVIFPIINIMGTLAYAARLQS